MTKEQFNAQLAAILADLPMPYEIPPVDDLVLDP